MNLIDACALLLAGFAASTVNAVAGGGSLITFPTLMAIGLPPVPANVTNSIAVAPGYLASVYGSRTDLAAVADRRGRGELLRLLPTAVGRNRRSAARCCSLRPPRAFELRRAVPRPRCRRRRSRSSSGCAPRRPPARPVPATATTRALHAMVGLGAVYGGYFGAALGVMLVAALALVLDETLAHVTALKNAVSAVVGVGTVVAFAIFGPVNWAAVAVVIPATVVGGYAGARLARRLPAATLRISHRDGRRRRRRHPAVPGALRPAHRMYAERAGEFSSIRRDASDIVTGVSPDPIVEPS